MVQGSPREILDNLKEQGYHKFYVDGGQTIQSFLKEDLIDELCITTIPVLLGDGVPLFGLLEKSLPLELVKSEVFAKQLVQSTYRRKR